MAVDFCKDLYTLDVIKWSFLFFLSVVQFLHSKETSVFYPFPANLLGISNFELLMRVRSLIKMAVV